MNNTSINPSDPSYRKSTYADVAARVQDCKAYLTDQRIVVHRDSALNMLFRDAESLARDWANGVAEGDIRRLINTAHANRIAEAILLLRDEAEIQEVLRRIARNNVDLSKRPPSQGKDALWELNLLALLRRLGVQAKLLDPPDIVANFEFGKYPIACKKIYSERGVEAQMRKGAKQLAPYQGGGLVALNIDDLIPEDVLLRSESAATAGAFLDRLNMSFIERHQIVLQRFVLEGKCDGVLVSTTALSDITNGDRTRFNTFTQSTLWTVNEADPRAIARINAVREVIAVHPGL
ncbi:hypothetical protein [Caballeronia glebae]|uniref:hypothetical protein n=1 Tax=Caballeronia glebae TaxID=1777143 RepID=UPI0038B9C4CE